MYKETCMCGASIEFDDKFNTMSDRLDAVIHKWRTEHRCDKEDNKIKQENGMHIRTERGGCK